MQPDDTQHRFERETLKDLADLGRDMAVLTTKVESLQHMIKQLVTRAEFVPVKALTYGYAASILVGVVAAMLAQVLK